jgi:hypothetical protein
MLISIGSYAICDGTLAGGVAIGQLRFGVDRLIEIVEPIYSAETDPNITYPILFDRKNRKTSITFTVQRTHASAGAAELFIASLDSSLPSTGNVILEFTTTGTDWHIPKGKVINHSSTQLGATTTTTYTIVGGGAGSGSGSG